ncbi:Fibronectin type III domain protein [Verrucomicrobia bacterium]|nr:Fibronectin type III domain protein [Verrucomicrobiota bacterium]
MIERTLRSLLLAAGTCLTIAIPGQAETFYERHVFFDNSSSDRSYYRSEGKVVAPSRLELIGGKFPVDSAHFLSPPNSLRLKWKSAPGGDWRLVLKSRNHYERNSVFEGDSLSLWCFSEAALTPEEAPRIACQDAFEIGSGTISLLADYGSLPPQEWVHLVVPLDHFKPLYGRTEEFNFQADKLAAVWLMQGIEDGRYHTLYIDDLQIVSSSTAQCTPPSSPEALQVRGGERHFDLSWLGNSQTNLLRYQIYRSWDGAHFVPIGIQQNRFNRFVDFVGARPRNAYYRITAVDASGNESAPSPIASASTHPCTDDELLDMVQEGCFRYYWEGGHPDAGMANETIPGNENLVAVGASGFGIMALIAGADRHFISREQCAERLAKITRFLRKADRFHGAWPHFLDGATGKSIPYFGKYDDGGDLVETAFLVQGLLVARQYFDRDTELEREIRRNVTDLWRGVEWDWYRKDSSSDFLYWHWSPDFGWQISHPLVGWNETMIVYLLAIASPTHPIPPSLYYSGWAGQSDLAVRYRRNWSRTTLGDHYTNGHTYYGFKLDVGEGPGADLFFTQFSFMGFDPRSKRDRYTDYFMNNRNIALINHAYCVENPGRYKGYGTHCWGLSAGINTGGGRPQPRDDNGTICCSAALGCFPYTPHESMAGLKHFYRSLGARVWGIYGFHDGFNETEDWFEPVWMGLNQAVITVMIENYRSGLIWKNFMANPEIQPALDAIGFTPDSNPRSPLIRPIPVAGFAHNH